MPVAETAVPEQHDTPPLPLWRNRDYMLLWSGQLISTTGSGVSQIAIPLLILALTGSAAQAGIAGAFNALPYLIFSLPAGAMIDRWNRKRVMILCDAGRALSVASIPLAALFGHLSVAQLYVTAFIEGSLFVFFNLAEVAALPRVVPTEQIPSASAQNEGGQIVAGLLAPPLGGVLYGLRHTVPFALDAVSYAASVVSLFFIRTEFQGERNPTAPRNLRAEVSEGVRWLWNQPLIRFMAFLTGGLNFAGNASGLLLIVLARNQHAPPAAIGLIFSIGSIGGLAGAFFAPRIQRRFGFGQVIAASVWVQAILFPLYAVASNPVLLGVIAAGIFSVSPIYNAVQFGYRISIIPDTLQGRVNSAFRLIAFGFNPLGLAACGVLIERMGAHATTLFFAAVMLALAVLTQLNSQIRAARTVQKAAA